MNVRYTHTFYVIFLIFFEWIYRYSWNNLSTVIIHHVIFTYIYKHDAVFSLNCYHLKTITLYLYILENCEYRLRHIKIGENIFNRKISVALLKLVLVPLAQFMIGNCHFIKVTLFQWKCMRDVAIALLHDTNLQAVSHCRWYKFSSKHSPIKTRPQPH